MKEKILTYNYFNKNNYNVFNNFSVILYNYEWS